MTEPKGKKECCVNDSRERIVSRVWTDDKSGAMNVADEYITV